MAQNGSTNRINFEIDFKKGDLSALQQVKNEINDIQKLLSNSGFTEGFNSKELQNMTKAAYTLNNALDQAFDFNLNTFNVQKFNNILKESGYSAESLKRDLSLIGPEGQKAFLNATNQLMQFNTVTKQTNKFLDGIATSLGNTIKWSIMSSIVKSISGTIQKSFYYVKDLDRELNDIRIVTGKSADEMSRFAENANNAAKNLAVSTEDYTQGSLIYYQQGLDDETVKTLTDITAKTSNVTGQSMSTVSEQLTAVWNGYQVANRAATEGMQVYEEYVDKLAAVGATTASDLEELSTAMSKVASAASSMGVDFDDLNAQIATIVSVTRQAPESVGTALKTIYARLGDLKVDGVDEFGTKLGEVSSQLQTMGINILDSNGDMREMSDVMAEVAKKWETWTSAQKEAAAIAMAGKRQYNNLVALFDNWDMYGEALETSMNAVGTLQEQQEIAMESLANKMDVLKATAEDLYDSLFDVDSISGLVEFGTGALQFLADFTDAIGGLNNLLPMLGSLGLQVFSEQIGRSLATVVINARNAKMETENMISSQQALQAMFQDSNFLADLPNQQHAITESLREMVGFYEEMSQYQSIMTQEQKQQYNEVLRMKNLAGNLAIDVEKQTYEWMTQSNYLEVVNSDLVKDLNNIEAMTDQVTKLNKVIEAINFGKGGGITDPDLFNTLIKDLDLTKDEFDQLILLFNSDFKAAGENVDSALDKSAARLRKFSEGLTDIIEKSSRMKSLNQNFKDMSQTLSSNMGIQAFITNTSRAIGAVGQLASSISTLSNLFENVWKNDSLSASEKFTQTLMNWGFAIPNLIASVTKLNETFKMTEFIQSLLTLRSTKITAAKAAETAAIAAHEAAVKADTLAIMAEEKEEIANAALHKATLSTDTTSEWIRNLAAEASERQINAIAIREENAGMFAAQIAGAKWVDMTIEQKNALKACLIERAANTTATNAATAADEARTLVVEQETIAQQGLNAALKANPLGAIITVITLAITVGYGLIKVIDAVTVSAKEAGENLDKTVEKYKELKEQLESSETELEEVTNKLKELKNIDNPTYVDQKEIAKLEATQSLLEAQIESEKELLRLQRQQVVKDATTAADKGTYDVDDPLEDYVDITKAEGWINTANDYTLNEEDVIDLDTFKANAYKKMQQALEDSGNELLSEEARNNALHAYDYYNSLFTNYWKDIEDSWYQRTSKLKESYTKTLEFLPDLYEESTFNGVYDDDNVNSKTIQYYEQIALDYYKATGAFQNILQKSANGVFENNQQIQDIINNLNNGILNTESHTIDEDALSKILSDEQIQELQLRTQTVGISLYDFFVGIKDYGIKYTEEVDEIVDETQAKLDAIAKKLSTTTEVIDALFSGKDLTEDQIKELEKLESEYEELATIQDRQSTAYLNKLLEIREALEKEQIEVKKQLENDLIDNASNKIKVYLDGKSSIDELKNDLKEICEADYSILVDVKADIQDDFDTAVTSIEAINNAAEKIGDDFVVAAKDIEELNDVFPGILANMDLVGDGTVKLNAEIVKGAMETAEAEVAADTDATIAKIKNQADQLAVKRDAARSVANIASQLVQNQGRLNEVEGKLNEALASLKSDNSDKVATQEQDDQNDVATNAATAATSMANSYGQAYEQMAKDAVTWANTAHQALVYGSDKNATKAPEIGEFGGASFSTTANVDEVNSNKKDLSSFEDYSDVGNWQEIADYYNQLADSYDESYNNALGKIAELLARGDDSKKKFSNIGKGLGSDGKKDKSKGGGDKDKKKDLKELDEEFDRYWQIKKAIDMLDLSISRLEKDQKNLHGKELIASLKKENELLAEQKGNYEALYKMQQQEQAELQAKLSGSGVIFDASGAITNYAQATAAALAQYTAAVNAYNAGLMDETAFEVQEKAYENFKKTLERYEALYYKEMQDTQDKIDDARRKQLENNLKAWETEIQIKLDLQEAEREWQDFLKDINEDFQSVFKDLSTDMDTLLKKSKTYTGKNGKDGTIGTDIAAIQDVMREIDKMKNGGESSMFESISQAQEKLKELQKKLQDDAKAMRDLLEEGYELYLKEIDQVADKFEAIQKRFNDINNQIKFYGDYLKLIGNTSFKVLDKITKAQEKAMTNQLKSLQKQSDMFKDQFYEALKKEGLDENDPTKWTKDIQSLYEKWQAAQEKVNDLAIDFINLLQEDYAATVDNILKEAQKSLFNGQELDEVRDDWERIKDYSDKYKNDVQKTYEISRFSNKVQQEMAGKTLKTQQKLEEFRKKQLEDLRAQKNLTQYDLDAAEAKLQIMLKEIALEEAQQNKTSMKMTRNEQGNWSYQYVADEDDQLSKRQELIDTWNDLYALADKAEAENAEAVLQIFETFNEKAQEISKIAFEDKEKADRMMIELTKWRDDELARLAEKNLRITSDLNLAGAGLLMEIYENDEEAYANMTENEQGLVDGFIENSITDYQGLEGAIEENLGNIGKDADQLREDTREESKALIKELLDKWNNDPDSVKKVLVQATKDIQDAFVRYQKQVDECSRIIGLDADKIDGKLNKLTSDTEALTKATNDLADDSTKGLSDMRDAVDALKEAWDGVRNSIMDTIDKLKEYLDLEGKGSASGGNSGGTGGGAGGTGGATGGGSGSGSGGGTTGDSTKKEVKKAGDKYKYYTDPNGAANTLGITEEGVLKYIIGYSGKKEDIKPALDNWAKGHGFDKWLTGGYTGDWGTSNGRPAVLHQKELVLNKEDTSNFLKGISLLRDMTALNGSISGAISNAVMGMAMNLGNISPGTYSGSTTTETNNVGDVFNITAEFPNANDVNEIREAILSLPRLASQYIGRNIK